VQLASVLWELNMPYGIIQCYLPPGRGNIPAFTPVKLVLDLATQEGCMAALTWLVGYIQIWFTHPIMVTHPSTNQV